MEWPARMFEQHRRPESVAALRERESAAAGRGHREGAEIRQVNPSFGSVTCRVKFVERCGLSVHQTADLVPARRLRRCSERIPRWRATPVGNGGRAAFDVPARKTVKHV